MAPAAASASVVVNPANVEIPPPASEPAPAAPVNPTGKTLPAERTGGGLLAWFDRWLLSPDMPSWLASAMVHALVVLMLSFLAFAKPGGAGRLWLEGAIAPDAGDTLETSFDDLSAGGGEITVPQSSATSLLPAEDLASTSIAVPSPLELSSNTTSGTPVVGPFVSQGQLTSVRGGGYEGRSIGNRRGLALAGGGTAESEAAVELGLAWLAEHQFPDGSWRFDLTKCPTCGGACRDSGPLLSTTAPTGLALMCFLGAGYTQDEGPYQDTISRGLYYLVSKMIITSMGGDLRDRSMLSEVHENLVVQQLNGDMYSHGIASLALCEAYGMTKDKSLAQPAQLAIDFIVYAQHEQGGWRYEPGQPGDASVSGWQVTALKSGLLAGLSIPRQVWYRASEYFDSVQDDRGATYGYQRPSSTRTSMSAVGLLCRMMLGWPHDHRPLLQGITRLGGENPAENHMYFNYYATQALHHFGGRNWNKWNPQMRDYLVETQSQEGHETGSWFMRENWSDRGGRLYSTTLAILTLEVYYRYMPMYQEDFVDNGP